MQYYDGCEELAFECGSIFDELEEKFIQNAKELASILNIQINNEFNEEFGLVFRAIIGTNYNKDELFILAKKCFNDNDLITKYIVSSCVLHLTNNFLILLKQKKPDKMRYGVYLANATERFSNIFGSNSFLQDDEEEYIQSNTIRFGSGQIELFGDIFEEFKTIQAQNKSLKMLNLYKGVNIVNEAKILELKGQNAILQVDLMQILAINEEGFAYILQSDNFSSNVQAKIVDFDIASSKIILNDFKRSKKTTAIMRKFPRVQPNKITPVKLSCEDGSSIIDGKLFDISQGGIGVVSSQNANWKSGENLKAAFNLNIGGIEKSINLDIELVVSLNYQGSIRYCCKINNNNQACMQDIIQFSDLRVQETIAELKDKASNLL